MDLKELGWKGVHWIDLARDRDKWRAVVKKVMNFSGFIKRGQFYN